MRAWHHAYGLPVVILKAVAGQSIPLYSDGANVRDLFYVEAICNLLDQRCPAGAPHLRLLTSVTDRPGHDRRYAIDPGRISSELGWQPRHDFEAGLAATVDWYLANLDWCELVRGRAGYGGERLSAAAG